MLSNKPEKLGQKAKTWGYGNIQKKSKEDLIQIIEELKEQNLAKDRVIHVLKVRNEKIKQNK